MTDDDLEKAVNEYTAAKLAADYEKTVLLPQQAVKEAELSIRNAVESNGWDWPAFKKTAVAKHKGKDDALREHSLSVLAFLDGQDLTK